MNIRSILLILLGAIIIVLNFIYGNAVSGFLSVCITSIIAYYLTQMYFERSIQTSVNAAKGDKKVLSAASVKIKRYRSLFNFVIMTAVFLSAVFCIRNVTMPRNADPYFYNNQYHAISNTGIAFQRQLNLFTKAADEYKGSITLTKKEDNVITTFDNFYEPAFLQIEENKYQLINPIFNKKIQQSFTIIKDGVNIQIDIEKEVSWLARLFGKSAQALYKVHMNGKAVWDDESNVDAVQLKEVYSFKGPYLQEGMSLYNLMFQQQIVTAPSSESMQFMQDVIQQIGNSYIVADHNGGAEGYYFFPNYAFIEQGYQLKIDGESISPTNTISVSIPKATFFYLGFHNAKEKMQFLDHESGVQLAFDYAPKYWTSVPKEQQVLNQQMSFFITNDFDQVIEGKAEEGFYFNNFGLYTNQKIEGSLQLAIGKPHDPLVAKVVDVLHPSSTTNNPMSFSLATKDKSIEYLFEVRDFSDNGFSLNKLLIYAGLGYIGILILLIFFPGKDLARIEASIMVLIYALYIVRLIMYWRITTFPPLDNISKYELENTILNFDFNFGIQWPIPLTVIWLYLFIILLILYRKTASYIVPKWQDFVQNRIVNGKWSIGKVYAIIMGILLFTFILNQKLLGVEILTRVLAIITPLFLYIVFSSISNRFFVLEKNWVDKRDGTFKRELKAYFYYFINNPAFIISLVTIGYFAITDRGFAVLFMLFLLLKNILLNFLKRSYNSEHESFWKMLIKPNNYWIYGIIFLILYFVVLSVKSFFYYLLSHYMWIIGGMIVIAILYIYLFYPNRKKWLKGVGIALGIYLVIVLIPFTRNIFDSVVREQIKHVQYRTSIIIQPISELLLENEYTSFSTQKIIETAENQWFINAYISKEYNPKQTINLRPYNKVGVNYNTQTRDVVLARFVISEMGNITMYLLLVLALLPLILYLISYKFTEDVEGPSSKVNVKTYAGVIPLIIFFTICLFVWLTSTNRFVFFGQDFPFLSLTSKTSMILPLMLLFIVLVQQPKAKNSHQVDLRSSFTRYALFVGMIVFFALITVKPNTLNTRNFSVVVAKTQQYIDHDLNNLLDIVQDSLSVKNSKYSLTDMLQALSKDERYQEFINNEVEDPYSKSIIQHFVAKPYSGFQVNSPLYVQYNGYRYQAMYNQHFYLELSPVDNQEVWHGVIAQDNNSKNNISSLNYNNENITITTPYFKNDIVNNIQLSIIPGSWLQDQANKAIIDVKKSTGSSTQVSIYKELSNSYEQKSTSLATVFNNNALVAVQKGDNRFNIQFDDRAQVFALNKWINGKYRILYPQRPKSLWIYHFAHSVKALQSEKGKYRDKFNVSLDFNLNKNVEQIIHQYAAPFKTDNKFKYAVIAADGDGHIHLMQDFVSNRKTIDANDNYSISRLKQEQFFFSNIRNERDQWGEANLLNMQLGPGSSIKPLIAGVVSSQVNAGWQHLFFAGSYQTEEPTYAGFGMIKPWKSEVQDRGRYGIDNYISRSSNFYHSLMLFLGSYPKESFIKDNKASLNNILVGNSSSGNNFPQLEYLGKTMFLPAYNKGKNNWPKSDPNASKGVQYFGNENSVLSNGLEINANLMAKTKHKDAQFAEMYDRINIIDSANYKILQSLGSANYLWSMPEESSFLQSLRSYKEIYENVNIGLKTSTLGGYPYQVSPFKMLEMYSSLMTQNRLYRLHLDNRKTTYVPWQVDDTWGGQQAYNHFLSSYIFKGMADAVNGGTASALNAIKSTRPDLYYYAKTGTINEQGSGAKSSKRLLVTIADKDLTQATNVGKAKVYTFYFMSDRTQNIDYTVVNNIIKTTMQSGAFKAYFE